MKRKRKRKEKKTYNKLKEVIKGIANDIKRVDKAIEEEDSFIGRPEVLALDKALARRYQHKVS